MEEDKVASSSALCARGPYLVRIPQSAATAGPCLLQNDSGGGSNEPGGIGSMVNGQNASPYKASAWGWVDPSVWQVDDLQVNP